MALSVYGSSRWILECSALKLAVVFFLVKPPWTSPKNMEGGWCSRFSFAFPCRWRTRRSPCTTWWETGNKKSDDFRPPSVWNGVCNYVVLGNLEVIRIQLVHWSDFVEASLFSLFGWSDLNSFDLYCVRPIARSFDYSCYSFTPTDNDILNLDVLNTYLKEHLRIPLIVVDWAIRIIHPKVIR